MQDKAWAGYIAMLFLSKTQLVIKKSNAGRFNPEVFVNCVQDKEPI